ncbi:transcription factor bHLH162 isoform X1 [Citrus clementina]|uniref:transcription factor bHLH162 isoform X1 n=1 Tax=Citrus clementina TaxID=85681 RepID=UPI000CED1BD7|nr:transcription factor bHLH162 isoform X1 [Citrus x clementina]
MKKRSDKSSKPERKNIEKNRRDHMKSLCFKLFSLVPSHHFRASKSLLSCKLLEAPPTTPSSNPAENCSSMLSQEDRLDLACCHIKQLRERIDKLKRMKEQAMKSIKPNSNNNIMDETNNICSNLPVVELRDLGYSIEVVLISGVQRNFMLYEVISILEEEGAQVVSASFSTIGDKIFHTVRAQAKISRLGVETSIACQRLHDLVD